MNIVLTGFMCAGKTTIGRKMAKLLDSHFIDTDIEIEEDQGCSVEDIFKYGGEECFREMETKLLEKLKDVRNSVISTGGGIILREYNRVILKQIGIQVYLKVPKKELLQRLIKVKNRPLFKNKDTGTALEEMFEDRNLLYEKAECIIDTGQQTPQQIALEIIRTLFDEDKDRNLRNCSEKT